ncbi:MAG: DUF3857 domain-containing protein [Pseudomonadota bacterium]
MKEGAFSARLNDVQFRVDATSVVYAHRAFVANEASALGALGQYEVQFQPEYQTVELHSLRILRGATVIDKLASASIRFLQRELNLDQGIYSGIVTAAIVTDDVRVGDTLELKYSILGQNPVFAGKFFEAAQWDSPYAIALRRVSIDTPATRKIHYKLLGAAGGKGPVPGVSSKAGRTLIRFQEKDIPQKLPEPYVPADVIAYRYFQFSELENWRDVNQWALRLFSVDQGASNLKDALAPARAAPTRELAVARVLEFVQNEIRYLSLSLGENSHRPYTPDQVLERRYGDCKDKSLLMVSMLRALDIDAMPVLVSTAQRKGLDGMLPSPLLFDHAIVRVLVNGKEYFLDPTRRGQYGALDRMGQAHTGAQVLVIKPGSTGLATITGEQADTGRLERVTVQDFDKPVDMLVRRSYNGVAAEYVRLQLEGLSKEQLHKAYDGVLGERYPSSRMIGEPIVRDDRAGNVLLVETTYRIDKFFDAQESGWQFRYVPSNMTDMFYVPGNARRDFPFAVPNFPSRTTYVLEVQLPEKVDANYKDAVSELKFAPVDVSETLSFTGRTLSARVDVAITGDRVDPRQLIPFLDGIKKFNAVLNGSLVVRKSDVKGGAPVVARRTLKEQLELNLAATTRLIADADLAGQDASETLCERALVLAYLGQSAEAIKDAGRAVQLRAQSGDMWKCRADTYFMAGKFSESDSDFSRAIARGSDNAATYLGKAINGLFLGKTASARIDFGRSAEKAEGAASRLQVSVWQAITNWQEGSRAATAPAGDQEATEWRAAARNMFLLDQAPDLMLRLASRDGGNGIDVRLTEAYFYAGKYYLLKQDKSRARVYFRRTVDKGVVDSLYHTVARHELSRLEK